MKELNSEIFEDEVTKADMPVVVDFWGPQCGPCLALMPKVEGLENKYAGKVKMTKVDVSKNRRFCMKLRILGLPAFLFFKDGKEVTRLSGDSLTIEEIETAINDMLK